MAGEVQLNVECVNSCDLKKLRGILRSYIAKHQYESALFWADKVVSLSKGEVQDLYWFAHTLYLTGQYHRAAHVLKSNKLEKRFLAGRYLAAKCHFECKEYMEALDVLDQKDDATLLPHAHMAPVVVETHPDIPCEKMESCLHLLRGKAHEALENRIQAGECFREALRTDVFCYEAFENLVNHHMMTADEENDLISSLPFKSQCTEEEMELLRFLYENKLKKYNKPSELVVPKPLQRLQENVGVVINMAERHYYNCDFKQCYDITKRVLSKDPYNEDCLPLHVSVLVELKIPNELFYLAHKLVDMYPNKAVSWFAVGCYYLLVGKNDPARRYLSKAMAIDRVFGPAWLAFGHSFAAENEHDQAMAAYFTASHIMRGCHLPVLYVGLEYGLTNNTKLAERFFSQACSIAPEDPFVLHEMGTVAFQNLDYPQAEHYFKSALGKIKCVSEDVLADKWEPLLNNLGHVCRKLKKYEESLEYHRQALILSPQNPSTYSAMGYVYALTGRCMDAADYFHKALGLRRDDTFSTTMLSYSMEKLMDDVTSSDHGMEEVPDRPFAEELKSKQSPGSTIVDTSRGQSAEDSTHETSHHSSLLEGEISMGDSSNMAIDTSMEDT